MSLLQDDRVYRYSSQMADFTGAAVASRVRVPASGEGDAEALLLKKLGAKGWGRVQHFRTCYAGGWGETQQKPLSPRSYDLMIKSLAVLDPPEDSKPSVFLTDSGFLELAWRDADGNAVQIEFGSRESEIYDEARGIEKTVPNANLIEALKALF